MSESERIVETMAVHAAMQPTPAHSPRLAPCPD